MHPCAGTPAFATSAAAQRRLGPDAAAEKGNSRTAAGEGGDLKEG